MTNKSETVYTVYDKDGGPLSGIANYGGAPHAFQRVFSYEADEWSDWYVLRPIDQTTFELAMEQWALWCQWERAYIKGEVKLDTHPALSHEPPRYEELKAILDVSLKVPDDSPLRFIGRFKADWDEIGALHYKVIWQTS